MQKFKFIDYAIVFVLFFSACNETNEKETSETMNPFFTAYNTPFEVPPFDQIENRHFKPAMERGMEEQVKEIEEIVSSKEEPTFENTIAVLDQTGKLLDKVQTVFYNLNSAHTNDSI